MCVWYVCGVCLWYTCGVLCVCGTCVVSGVRHAWYVCVCVCVVSKALCVCVCAYGIGVFGMCVCGTSFGMCVWCGVVCVCVCVCTHPDSMGGARLWRFNHGFISLRPCQTWATFLPL